MQLTDRGMGLRIRFAACVGGKSLGEAVE